MINDPASSSDSQSYWDNFVTNVLRPNIQPIARPGRDLAELASAAASADANSLPAVKIDRLQQYESSSRSIRLDTLTLYSNCVNPVQSIKIEDVRLGCKSDKYFDAALAAVANRQPQVIRDSIQTNADGTYTVTFRGDLSSPVTVQKPTLDDLYAYESFSSDGFWPAVMEKAFAAYMAQYQGLPTASEYISFVVRLLTGAVHIIESDTECDDDRLQQAMSDLTMAAALGHYAVVETTTDNPGDGASLLPDQTYTVLAYTPGLDGGEFLVRNPRGDGDFVSVSARSLARSLNHVAVASVKD